MEGLYICKDLLKWINEGNKKGIVHSVFKNSVNILGDENIFISVVTGDKPISPNGIKILNKIEFNSLGINQGEVGIFTKEGFNSKNLHISYKNSMEWRKDPIYSYEKINLEDLKKNIKLLGQFLSYKGNKNGIIKFIPKVVEKFNLENSDLNINIELEEIELFILDRLINFIDSFIKYDFESINENARKIIGYGPGLTPSMDDFISGMMVAHAYLTDYRGKSIKRALDLNREIIRNIQERTTRVSEEMLKFSSMAEANEDIRNMIVGILSMENNDELNRLFEKVANIGDSSGTDILSGVYIGSLILLSK